MATLEDRLTLAAFNAATEGRGNVRLVWGTYIGTGEAGKDHPNLLSFDSLPLRIVVQSGEAYNDQDQFLEMRQGGQCGTTTTLSNTEQERLTWSGNSVSWYTTGTYPQASYQMNAQGVTYYYLALLAA